MMVIPEKIFDELLPRLMSMTVSFAIVAVCLLLTYYFWGRSINSKKHQRIVRKRFMYVMLVIDIFILAKIWVEGFTHLLTVFSLVAAGLVVVNKESIMNLIAGLIINWRDLFVEGDFIQIQSFSGYVASIGFMYFKLYETVAIDQKKATGRTIKIPNSLVMTAPLVNFSPESNLCFYQFMVNCRPDAPLADQVKLVLDAIVGIIENIYQDHPGYKKMYVKAHNRELSHLIDLQPSATLATHAEKENPLRITVHFYCFSKDYAEISQQFWLKVY